MISSYNPMFGLELIEFCFNIRMLIIHIWYPNIMVYSSDYQCGNCPLSTEGLLSNIKTHQRLLSHFSAWFQSKQIYQAKAFV